MGSPQRGEDIGKEHVNNEATQDQQTAVEKGQTSRENPQATAPIEMSEMNEHPPAPALENSQWPLGPSAAEATEQSQAPQSVQDKQPETSPPPTIAPASTPLREPLAITSANAASPPAGAAPYPLTREKTGPAIGPPSDKPIPSPQEPDPIGLSLFLTLLLTSGARHPFKIDERYLNKRNVKVDGSNPVNMSVYTLKELIWREWRDGKRSETGSCRAITDQ